MWRRWLCGLAGCFALAGLAPATPSADGWGRVGRIAETVGTVWVYDEEEGDWTPAQRNRPLGSGDRISTAGDGRAELSIGSTTLRVAGRSEVELLRVDDERVEIQLHGGRAALRVRSREAVEETTLVTAEARLRPLRPGHYRFDREDELTSAAALSGELLLDGPVSFPIGTGTRMDFWLERGRGLQHRWAEMPADDLAAWLAQEDLQERRTASARYVSPEMTGAEDLDRYGRWDRHPEYGAVWIPLTVAVDWAPYRTGHWAWIRPWGWTWVDAQPWGFAPFHYGRWAHWRGRWCWVPGPYAARPVYRPALVAWIGGPSVSVGITYGGRPLPGTHWVPLAPRDPYLAPPGDRRPPGPQRSPQPAAWHNQQVPGAVTPLSRDALLPRVVQPRTFPQPPRAVPVDPRPHARPGGTGPEQRPFGDGHRDAAREPDRDGSRGEPPRDAGRREPPPAFGRPAPMDPAPAMRPALPPAAPPAAPVLPPPRMPPPGAAPAPQAPPVAAPVPPAPPSGRGAGLNDAPGHRAPPPGIAPVVVPRAAPQAAPPAAASPPPAPAPVAPAARAAPPAAERRAPPPRSERPPEARESREGRERGDARGGGGRERAAQP